MYTSSSSAFRRSRSDDPAPGLFSFEIDPVEANQIVLAWNMPRACWFSGTWDQQSTDNELQLSSGNENGISVESDQQLHIRFLKRIGTNRFILEVVQGCSNASVGVGRDNRCSIWIGDLLNLQQLGYDDTTGNVLYIKLADSEIDSETSPTNTKRVIVVAIMTRRLTIISTELGKESLVAFGYKDLEKATNSEMMGKGGFGSVFKGTLPDRSIIAVKKLESINQGEKQFCTEISTIGKINHVNLVRLRGFCSEGSRKLLVYDFMPNGTLDRHLFHGIDSEPLDWKTRYQVALGAARDFGLAKLLGREFSRVLTTVRGTVGYLAPEWISGVAITPKADVYTQRASMDQVVQILEGFFDLSVSPMPRFLV
ncbi:hypothetical protein V6N11_074869 [Hibiscus sabdariffa]|uniref:Protein kinase domain-containing protein n=1 Tax=Hibiscus sabdariffa TaxID=183260 RepID=A0ABR2R4Y1_9ROSI